MDSTLPIRQTQDRSKESTAAGIPWLGFHRARRTMSRRWPSAWSLNVICSPFAEVSKHIETVNSVLDVGATSRVWEPTVHQYWPSADYRSLDIDRTSSHDYYDFEEVDRQFDFVMLIEVLEHLAPADVVSLLQQSVAACKPNGFLLASVPNVLTPGHQDEFTHQTAFSYCDLPALFTWAGLDVIDGARWWMGDKKRMIWHRYLLIKLHRALGVDFCPSIVMLGQKPGS